MAKNGGEDLTPLPQKCVMEVRLLGYIPLPHLSVIAIRLCYNDHEQNRLRGVIPGGDLNQGVEAKGAEEPP